MLLLTTRTPTDMVMQSVAKEFKVSVELIKSPCRKREYSEARQAFIGLAYKRRVVTQEYLAHLLDRSHSTINTAIDTFSDLYDTNKPFREKVIKVKQVLDIL